MSEKTAIISERDGKYQIQNNGMSEFELLGILECIVFDIKSAGRESKSIEQKEIIAQPKQTLLESKETVHDSNTPDLRTRITNAIKTIKSLGGVVEEIDLSNSTDEELQLGLEELTNQYKRLKNSKRPGK